MKDLFPRTVSRLDSECTYTTGVEETSVPNTFNGNNDVRSCPFGSFRNTQSVQNCVSDATFLNPTTGVAFPLMYVVIDATIFTNNEPEADEVIALLTSSNADGWGFGRQLDKHVYENVIPSSGGRARISTTLPVDSCPLIGNLRPNEVNDCCYSAPVIYGTDRAQTTWQASCKIEPHATIMWPPEPPPQPPSPPPNSPITRKG